MSTAEELQIINYGIGGFYKAHYDFSTNLEDHFFHNLGIGNRIATTLFYVRITLY